MSETGPTHEPGAPLEPADAGGSEREEEAVAAPSEASGRAPEDATSDPVAGSDPASDGDDATKTSAAQTPAPDGPDEAAVAAMRAETEVESLLGPDVRTPAGIPKDYRPSDSAMHAIFRIDVEDFAGPMDLLLYLIRKHELDVFDIPIKFITDRYLEVLETMRQLEIDVAAEFLVLAAELVHIKSKMLLPSKTGVVVDDDIPEDEGDPRAELVRRLLEYQKYRDAAHQLSDRDQLGRDVFARVAPTTEAALDEVDPGLKSVSIFKLVEMMAKLLRRAPIHHEISYEAYSIGERIHFVLAFGEARGGRFTLSDLLEGTEARAELVVTFIAVLEMTKLGLIRIFAEDAPPRRSIPKAPAVPPGPEPAQTSSSAAARAAPPAKSPTASAEDLGVAPQAELTAQASETGVVSGVQTAVDSTEDLRGVPAAELSAPEADATEDLRAALEADAAEDLRAAPPAESSAEADATEDLRASPVAEASAPEADATEDLRAAPQPESSAPKADATEDLRASPPAESSAEADATEDLRAAPPAESLAEADATEDLRAAPPAEPSAEADATEDLRAAPPAESSAEASATEDLRGASQVGSTEDLPRAARTEDRGAGEAPAGQGASTDAPSPMEHQDGSQADLQHSSTSAADSAEEPRVTVTGVGEPGPAGQDAAGERGAAPPVAPRTKPPEGVDPDVLHGADDLAAELAALEEAAREAEEGLGLTQAAPSAPRLPRDATALAEDDPLPLIWVVLTEKKFEGDEVDDYR